MCKITKEKRVEKGTTGLKGGGEDEPAEGWEKTGASPGASKKIKRAKGGECTEKFTTSGRKKKTQRARGRPGKGGKSVRWQGKENAGQGGKRSDLRRKLGVVNFSICSNIEDIREKKGSRKAGQTNKPPTTSANHHYGQGRDLSGSKLKKAKFLWTGNHPKKQKTDK